MEQIVISRRNAELGKLRTERIMVIGFGKTYKAKKMLTVKFLKPGLSTSDYRKKK